MHDIRDLLADRPTTERRFARRGYTFPFDLAAELERVRLHAVRDGDTYRTELKSASRAVASLRKSGEDDTDMRGRAAGLKASAAHADAIRANAEERLHEIMLAVPNLPADDVPDGGEDNAVEVRRVGEPPTFDFTPLDHVDIGERLGIFDFPAATKLSGPRFAVLRGVGAKLDRALATMFLDIHADQGYTEVGVPFLVNRKTMTGTGQLPKFEDDLFATAVGDRELFLIPTAEVPLTNLHAGEVIPVDTLPIAYTAVTPCFRSEAGSYGRDTRGMIRLHQFQKVEMVRIVHPDHAPNELERLVEHAEACLDALGLAYRVVELAAGDLGFSARRTFDIEVWLPGQDAYREISSCSDTGTFQARRASIRFKDGDGRKGFAATLNGSGLPTGRAMAALLEQHQNADGSVNLPSALVPYAGFAQINADGTVER